MTVFILVGLAFLGLCLGSFAGAQVWRLRARQLMEDRDAGEEYDKQEYKRLAALNKHTVSDDRSQCLHCGHRLAWYDLLPLISWLSTTGRCRYCKHTIGAFEPLIELGVATFFIVSYIAWPNELGLHNPLELGKFILWLGSGVMLAILFSYDAKWYLLPDRIVFPLMIVAVLIAQITIMQSEDVVGAIISLDFAVAILSGLYLVVYILGEWLGRHWIGFGDVKLGLVLALLLADWKLAFTALFLANLLGCIVIIPLMASKKLKRHAQVPFGPFLIAGSVMAALWGPAITDWYLSLMII